MRLDSRVLHFNRWHQESGVVLGSSMSLTQHRLDGSTLSKFPRGLATLRMLLACPGIARHLFSPVKPLANCSLGNGTLKPSASPVFLILYSLGSHYTCVCISVTQPPTLMGCLNRKPTQNQTDLEDLQPQVPGQNLDENDGTRLLPLRMP